MFYTLLTLLMFLVTGAPKFDFGFNPVFMAFVVAILVDLFLNRSLFIKPTV